MSEQSTSGDPMAAFGPNEWLVDELYQQYLTDKQSVDQAWWEFFEDYRPGDAEPNGRNGSTATATTATTATTVSAPAPAAAPSAPPAPASAPAPSAPA
ncbi:2-oxoglutarate dehydrogenase E1 subunit family protein, partial [Intrasporangium oryzae]|uniref:2-oxoglutarate dehydrogenase E1 subunit family protein n=1 Tax=Intrasporangium oryzae TaxID=412687 RepID=UPI0005522660